MYKFTLPIGDWSDDGHCRCSWYTVQSNVPVEEVREAFFKAKQITHITPENICCNYEDSEIKKEQYLALGLPEKNYITYLDYEEDGYTTGNLFAQLVLDYIMFHNPSITLELIPDLPMLPFYGYDQHNRHISSFGYGIV